MQLFEEKHQWTYFHLYVSSTCYFVSCKTWRTKGGFTLMLNRKLVCDGMIIYAKRVSCILESSIWKYQLANSSVLDL